MQLQEFLRNVEEELLPHLQIESVNPYDPVVVRHVSPRWDVVGAGNYAAVFSHPRFAQWVVKIYAPGRPGWEEEVRVYQKLGNHPAYSRCLHAAPGYLVLKRLTGIPLYECFRRGIRIPEQVVRDIDAALAYARDQGLCPHDVHAKNVMMKDGRGLVVDVSDFGKQESCSRWDDLKRVYYKLYLPVLHRYPVPIPSFVLNLIRKSYRLFKRVTASD